MSAPQGGGVPRHPAATVCLRRDVAGLPDKFVPHSLRHYFASLALAPGIPITDVSRWLGHKSIEVTYRIYGHLVPGSWERAREVLDAAYREGQAGL